MSTKHTPGPWELEQFHAGAFVIRGNSPEPYGEGMVITKRDIGTVNQAEGEANARLIAAAPELLDAARAALEVIDFCLPYITREEDRRVVTEKALRAAIAKAEGT